MRHARMVAGTGRRHSRMGEPVAFAEGLYEVAPDTYAWMVPNGSWGETNLGLVRCGDQSVLIDTCWDLHFMREMLAHSASVLDAAPITHVINTHADGDHCWGNQLFANGPITSTQASALQMHQHPPFDHTTGNAGTVEHRGAPVSAAPYGSASILPISWAYARMMGADGLRDAGDLRRLLEQRLGHSARRALRGGRGRAGATACAWRRRLSFHARRRLCRAPAKQPGIAGAGGWKRASLAG